MQDEITFYTNLGSLGPDELGLDREGNVMALADYISGQAPVRRVCLLIRADGRFEVYELEDVPMSWPVSKAKLMIIAAPVSEAESNARDAAREAAEREETG